MTSQAATNAEHRGLARATAEKVDGEHVELSIPHTDYLLRLRLAASGLRPVAGQRVSGLIEADALRIHPARGGGRFIEPAWGEPRIVAGTVRAVDEANRRVLVDAAVPMWLRAAPGQNFSVIVPGCLVNCHVRSGVTFAPVSES